MGSTYIRIGPIRDRYRIASCRYGIDIHLYRFDVESILDQHRFVSGRYVIDIDAYLVDMGPICIDISSI